MSSSFFLLLYLLLNAIFLCLCRIAASLAADHASVLTPDTETPFHDATDVVKRLLPYHVFQYPQEDLMKIPGYAKGKRKATEEEMLREEIAGTSRSCSVFSPLADERMSGFGE